MILIKKPYLTKEKDVSTLICDIIEDNEKKIVWFSVNEEYEQYLCTERSDAFVIGILNYAMRNNHDIICEVPMTEELYYNITTFLIPTLYKYGKTLSLIKIKTELAPTIMEGTGVGTGCSCGVDSFYSINQHINNKCKEFNLTHLCINNVGAFASCYRDIVLTKKECYKRARKVAKELNIPIITTDSNFQSVFIQNHYLTHTFSSCFAIYMLQKLFCKYYYSSSGIDFASFSLKDNDLDDCAHYELLSLQCFSTQGLRIYSDGGEKNRFEKTEAISDFDLARNNLHVCAYEFYNCGKCAKCMRTILALDALDKLENFSNVFDLDYYKKNKKEYYIWLYSQHIKNDEMNEPTYKQMEKRKEFTDAIISINKEDKIKQIKNIFLFVPRKIKFFLFRFLKLIKKII